MRKLLPVLLITAASLGIIDPITSAALPQPPTNGSIVPLRKFAANEWVERVWGNPDSADAPFVIRIHNDAGYIVFPHVHPMDENIVVVQGEWSIGMGDRWDRSRLAQVKLGDFALIPRTMAHFAWSNTETVIQVHGTGPFVTTVVDTVYELNDKGVQLKISLLRPGTPTHSSPPDCFALRVGTRVRGERGEGTVVGALCSPANRLTQYWVERKDGSRFWAVLHDLTPLP